VIAGGEGELGGSAEVAASIAASLGGDGEKRGESLARRARFAGGEDGGVCSSNENGDEGKPKGFASGADEARFEPYVRTMGQDVSSGVTT
jgi:hypothetical protein